MNTLFKALFQWVKATVVEFFSGKGGLLAPPVLPDAAAMLRNQKGYSELVQGQFDFLIEKLDNFQVGYYKISENTFELLDRIAALKAELITAKLNQCTVKKCPNRLAE